MNYQKAATIISKHYSLPFPIGAQEAKADIEKLIKKGKENRLSSDDLDLAIKLYEEECLDLTGFNLAPNQEKNHVYASQIGM